MQKKFPIWLVNGIFLALIAWQAAGLVWRGLSPASPLPNARPAAAVPVPVALPDLSGPGRLFGVRLGSDNGEILPSSLPYKLRGVIGGKRGKNLAAVLSDVGPKDVAVVIGDDIQPGVKLLDVLADHIVLDNNGRRERIDLDAKPATVIGGIEEGPGAAKSAPPPDGPPGGNVMALLLPRAHLVTAMQDSNIAEWAAGLKSDRASGGVRVVGGGARSLIEALQLNEGDILQRVNGHAMARGGDITLLYNEFSQKNNVKLELLRGGRPLTLDYTLQP